MVNENVREVDPVRARHDREELLLHLFGRAGIDEAHAVRQPKDVGIDDEPVSDTEGGTHHHVGGLASDSRKAEKLLHRSWHFAFEVVANLRRSSLDRLGFVSKETGRTNELFQLGPVGAGVVARLRESLEQRGRNFVDSRIGALG